MSYEETVVGVLQFFNAIEALGFKASIVESVIALPPVSPESLPQIVKSNLNMGRPLAIYFGAKWCGACKIMERTTLVDADVNANLSKFRFLKLDVEEEPDAAATLRIVGVPTLVILDSGGQENYRYVGPLKTNELRLVLEEFND